MIEDYSLSLRKLSEGLCGLVEDYGLVRYVPLAIQDRESLEHVLGLSDKANGYVFARIANDNPVVPPPELMYGSAAKVSQGVHAAMPVPLCQLFHSAYPGTEWAIPTAVLCVPYNFFYRGIDRPQMETFGQGFKSNTWERLQSAKLQTDTGSS